MSSSKQSQLVLSDVSNDRDNRYTHAIESNINYPPCTLISKVLPSTHDEPENKYKELSSWIPTFKMANEKHDASDQKSNLRNYTSLRDEFHSVHHPIYLDHQRKISYDLTLQGSPTKPDNPDTEQLQFELRRREKIMSILRTELDKKQATIKNMQLELNSLKDFKQNVELERHSDRTLCESRASTQLVLKVAELEIMQERSRTLEKRLSEMEDLLRQKDKELQTLQNQAINRENEALKRSRELQALQYENSVKMSSLMAFEKERASREEIHFVQCRDIEENYKQHLKEVEMQHEFSIAKLMDRFSEMQKKYAQFKESYNDVCQENSNLKLSIEKASKDKKNLESKLIDMEAGLTTLMAQNRDVGDFSQRELEYQSKIEELKATIRSMEDKSLLLQMVHDDNVSLVAENKKLQPGIYGKFSYRDSEQSYMNFPKPIGLKHVYTDKSTVESVNQSINQPNRDHWSSIDKWKLDTENFGK